MELMVKRRPGGAKSKLPFVEMDVYDWVCFLGFISNENIQQTYPNSLQRISKWHRVSK